MKKMMRIFVLLAIMTIPLSMSVALAKHPKHSKHKRYKNTKSINPATQGASWR